MLLDVLRSNQQRLDQEATEQYLDDIVHFIQSLPDREVVIMQIARHLALSLPFRSFIVEAEHQRTHSDHGHGDGDGGGGGAVEAEEDSNHLLKIDKFLTQKIREWMGSIL